MIKAEELSEVFKSSGIKRPSDDLNRLQRMIENSGVLITAWDNHRLIGVARAITDYSYCCYLSDLAVNKDYQNKGIGRELIRLVQEQIGEEVALLLLSSPIAMEYYPKIGFEKIENGFKIARKR
ncbi:GNAT family N-acetyltransferase [Psychrobacillus sp. FSL K6-2836]|uniref:GNAT family N-acetyltransferase n=1 Tax=Psychrobacillus sp. FSL K6-2836 TaxID=2921548 RepID=UPI0030F70387